MNPIQGEGIRIFKPLWFVFSLFLIFAAGCEMPTVSSDMEEAEKNEIKAYLPLEGTTPIPIITSSAETEVNKRAFQKVTKGQAMNRVTAYLKTKPGPHVITSIHKGTPEDAYIYAERSVPIPKVLAEKANGKEITYVYTERTKDGKVARTAMVRIPDTPEIRTLMAKWFRNGLSRRDPARDSALPGKFVDHHTPVGIMTNSCELGPDEIDPRCIDNEQYYDPDLGTYVLCEIIVCDEEELEGDGGGSNPPGNECTWACDPGWGEPGGGGGGASGVNLPSNPANNDIFVVIDPNTGEMYDLTFLQDYMSWLTPELRTTLLSSLLYVNLAPPETLPDISGGARILATVWGGAVVVDPFTPAGEIVAIGTSLVLGAVVAIEAWSFFANYSANMVKRRNMCLQKYLTCIGIYGNNPNDGISCNTCQQNCIVNASWPDYMCPL